MRAKRGDAQTLRDWFNDGADGAIDWGSPGDFAQCVAVAGKYMDDPEGYCNLRHQDAVGGPPGSEDKRMSDPVLKFTGSAEVKDGVITAILSTEAVDRDGDIVRLSGWRLGDLDGLPLMSCHNYDTLQSQIGEWRNIRVDPQRKALIGEPEYYTDCGNPEADYAYQIALKGRARYSVGFMPEESQPRKGAGREYTGQELLEASQVPIPSNREAVQLAVKAFRTRWGNEQRQAQRLPLRKWASNNMDPEADTWGSPDIHCIVAGCDDAAQTTVPICSEHLKYLMNSAPEPPGSPPDDDDLLQPGVYRALQARVKAGRVISAANMDKLHTAISNLKQVHDGACTDDDCPLDASGETQPPAEPPQQSKAMNESDGSAGGTLICPHCDPKSAVDAAADKCNCKQDCGEDKCPKAKGKALDADAIRSIVRDELTKAPQSTAEQNDLPDSAFAVVSSGGTKKDGVTTPKSLRHLPHHKADGSIDLPHLRNALARVSQTDLSSADKATAEKHLDAHAKEEKIGDYAEKSKRFDWRAAIEEVVAGTEW